MDDLVTWLRAQLDDDERSARFVAEHNIENLIPSAIIDKAGATVFFTDEAYGLVRRILDPARVLAEVDAKRRILDHCAEMLRPDSAWGGPTDPESIDPGAWYVLRLLALPYADRPGYRDEWKP